MAMEKVFVLFSLLCVFVVCSIAKKDAKVPDPDVLFLRQRGNRWFEDGENLIKKNLKEKNINKKAKGVILFLGDGMGISTVTAARILDGQLKNKSGEDNVLSWETFPNVGLSKTYTTNAQVADSAGTATSFLTGVKSYAGAISVTDNIFRGECSNNVNENKLMSILELAELEGLSTGVVTTTRVTHATPSVAYAHSSERNYESDKDLPTGCKGVKDIARQLIEFPYGNGLEVVLGGGRMNFLPVKKFGVRRDRRNLVKEWEDKTTSNETYKYIKYKSDLKELNPQNVDHVLGLFSHSHMKYSYNRKEASSKQPSLVEMTEFAINILQKNKKGFFLLVEGGRIDHGHHASKAFHALHDTIEMNRAVDKAISMINKEETLLMVTADHSHVFTIAGYQPRNNPIFDFASKRKDRTNKKYTTLGYQNGPGAKRIRPEPTREELEDPDYAWQSLVPLSSETHGGEDVGIYAQGPQAHLVRGVVEQNYIFHVMDYALCLSEGKKQYCREEGLTSHRRT